MFSLDEKQIEKLEKWNQEQEAKAAEKQGKKEPYYGAIGGALTYMFTPTSLGLVAKVEHGYTKETIDLTNYSEW